MIAISGYTGLLLFTQYELSPYIYNSIFKNDIRGRRIISTFHLRISRKKEVLISREKCETAEDIINKDFINICCRIRK